MRNPIVSRPKGLLIMPIPLNTIQAAVVQKTSILAPVFNVHQICHIVTANIDLDKYNTLKQFWYAGNRQFSIHDTLDVIENVLLTSHVMQHSTIPSSPPSIHRISRSNVQMMEKLWDVPDVKIVEDIMSPVTRSTPK